MSIWNDKYVFFKDRPEWSDVEPLEQDDPPGRPVVKIAYSDKFQDVNNYVRACLSRQEYSCRALHLTTEALQMNPANYTVWHYRRQIMEHLSKQTNDNRNTEREAYDHVEALRRELSFTQDVIMDSHKNYQVWFHRQWLAEQRGDGLAELDLTEDMIDIDSKNYHAWEHRQWTVKRFNLWDNELEYVDGLLKADCRNNSAWNHRYFVIKENTDMGAVAVQSEMNYVMNSIRMTPHNESAWAYLVGLIKPLAHVCKAKDRPPTSHVSYPQLLTFANEIVETERGENSPHAQIFLLDYYKDFVERNREDNSSEMVILKKNALKKCCQACDTLALQLDRIRRKYWRFIEAELRSSYPTLVTADDEGDAS